MFLTTMLVAQTVYQPEGLVKKVITGIQIDLGSVIIKDNDGKLLDVPEVSQMLQSGKYSVDAYADEQDRIQEIVLRPSSVSVMTVTSEQQLTENDLAKELEEIRAKDQALRKILDCIRSSIGNYSDSDEYKYILQLMAQEDKKNQERVTQIIDEKGWLGISQVGFMANNGLFLVIQHADTEIQEKYFPLLKESVEKGESNPADMALRDDRIRMRRKQKQLYGSQTTTINGKSYVWPIEDAANVDERRQSVHLSSLAAYLQIMGLSYPQDELPPELMK
jgi:hypothetical protein